MTDAAKGRQPRCPTCGKFMAWDTALKRWWCFFISWDSYSGGYEHD